MKLTILTIGSRGDIQPLIPLALALRDAGYTITIATHEVYRDLIRGYGLDFALIEGNPQAILEGESGQEWLETGDNPLKMFAKMRELATPMIHDMTLQVIDACQSADAVIFSTLSFYPLIAAYEKLDVKLIAFHLVPIHPTRAFPMSMMPDLPDWLPMDSLYNRFSYEVGFWLNWRLFKDPINHTRQQLLGLPPLPLSFNQMLREPNPTLYGYSPHVIPRPADWDSAIHVTGYWFMDDPDWTPPQHLTDFLDAGSAPVYIGFGSMTNRDPKSRTEIVLSALEKTGQRGILLSGWGGIHAEDLPEHVCLIDSAPHSWLFPRMRAVVHHGGAGTTAAGLRAGVPSVLVPHFADQPFWGRQVHKLGVGPKPIPRAKLTADTLANAIAQAVSNEVMQGKARDLGEKIYAEDGVGNAVEAIQKILGNR